MQCDSTLGSRTRELEDKDGPSSCDTRYKSEPTSTQEQAQTSSFTVWLSPKKPGVCGLSNLGNSSYMNCVLQCLTNTEPLRDYFDEHMHTFKKHNNEDNNQGPSGPFAEAFGALLKSGLHNACSPEEMKTLVEKFAPQLSSPQQHDSHEFLAFFLQRLHEDINHVKERPHTDMMIEKKQIGEQDIAEEFWYKHPQWNQNIVVDLFQGQLRFTMQCWQCYQVSQTYNLFMFLSLPLPLKQTLCISVVVVRADPTVPSIKYSVEMPKNGTIKHMKASISQIANVKNDRMMVAKVHDSLFTHEYEDCKFLGDISSRDDIYVYELRHPVTDLDWRHLPLYHKREIQQDKASQNKYTKTTSARQLQVKDRGSAHAPQYEWFGMPTYISVPRHNCTCHTIHQAAVNHCRQHLSKEVRGKGTKSREKMEVQLVAAHLSGNTQVLENKTSPQSYNADELSYIFCEWSARQCHALEDAVVVTEDVSCAQNSKPPEITLFSCLDLFTKDKLCSPDDGMLCSQCKKPVAKRKCDIWKLPPVLVVHLIRDKHHNSSTLVHFPIKDLDLSDLVKAPGQTAPTYDLFAVTDCSDAAYCKKKALREWYHYKDTQVSEIPEDKVLTCTAKLLFYIRHATLKRPHSPSFIDAKRQKREWSEAGREESDDKMKLIKEREQTHAATEDQALANQKERQEGQIPKSSGDEVMADEEEKDGVQSLEEEEKEEEGHGNELSESSVDVEVKQAEEDEDRVQNSSTFTWSVRSTFTSLTNRFKQWYNRDPGICGLHNLGNTCYMNSALQCLSNTEPLTEYFVEKNFKEDINKDNPLGMGGAVAETYGALVKDMWSGQFSTCYPRDLKGVMGKLAPQFLGNQQEDSHELLTFLLDGLHEDLNLVVEKPYVDMTTETEGREDKDIAEEFWYKHLQRNQSIVVDLFQGQLRSTMQCLHCNQVSKTFDPFSCLQLPVKQTRSISVMVVKADQMAPVVKYCVEVPKNGTVAFLKEEVALMTGIKEEKLIAIKVGKKYYIHVYNDHESLGVTQDNDNIHICELNHSLADADWMHIPTVHRKRIVQDAQKARIQHQPFGVPTYISVPRNKCTHQKLYEAAFDKFQSFLSQEWKGGAEKGSSKEDLKHKKVFSLVVAGRLLKNDDTPFRHKGQSTMFCDWSVEICDMKITEAASDNPSHAVNPVPSQDTTLFKCLHLFTKKKKLGTNDAWFCPNCMGLVKATRKCDLWKLPPVLVIHLTRFIHDRYKRQKSCTFVHFPIKELGLSAYVKAPDQPEPTYDLFAVINHSGGIGGGHYTAYCKNKTSGKWYHYNDTQVSEISEDEVVTRAAYVLFYRCSDKDRFTMERLSSQSSTKNVKEKDKQLTMKSCDRDDEEMEVESMDQATLKRPPSHPSGRDVEHQLTEIGCDNNDVMMEVKVIAKEIEQDCVSLEKPPNQPTNENLKGPAETICKEHDDTMGLERRTLEKEPVSADMEKMSQSTEMHMGCDDEDDEKKQPEDMAKEKKEDCTCLKRLSSQSFTNDVNEAKNKLTETDCDKSDETMEPEDRSCAILISPPSQSPEENEGNQPVMVCDKNYEKLEQERTRKKEQVPALQIMYFRSLSDEPWGAPETVFFSARYSMPIIEPLAIDDSEMGVNENARERRWKWCSLCPCCTIL